VARIARDPWGVFVARWNWKAALLSGAVRGVLYALLLIRHPADAARGAGTEMVFRVALGGCWGSLMQALRRVQPAWLAGFAAALALPAAVQALEYAALKLGGAGHLKTAMVTSTLFSAGSLAFNYSLMRRGLMVTGEGAESLASDFRRLPRVLGEWGRSVRRAIGGPS
jgi:hypothetical protein